MSKDTNVPICHEDKLDKDQDKITPLKSQLARCRLELAWLSSKLQQQGDESLVIRQHFLDLLVSIAKCVADKNIRKSIITSANIFDEQWYLASNGDVREAGLDPIDHFVEYGILEGRAPSLVVK